MKNTLAPTLQRLVDTHWVLWFEVSNSYSIVDEPFYANLQAYLKANTTQEFSESLNISHKQSEALQGQLDDYLHQCTIPSTNPSINHKPLERSTNSESVNYHVNGKFIRVHYDTASVKRLIHPGIAHHHIAHSTTTPDVVFDIQLREDQLWLYDNERLITVVEKTDYHLIQGKFDMRLLCAIYNTEENDWAGTFHASTVSNGNAALLCIGSTGQGKSTLTALLAAHGFDLVADDVTPLRSSDLHTYKVPKAVSIKQGAFHVLQGTIPNLESLPAYTFSTKKGATKYVHFNAQSSQTHYPCRTVILVNYKAKHDTELTPLSVAEALQMLIPDTWLSPLQENAEAFLNWIASIRCYQLTYSDFNAAKVIVTELLDEDHKYFSD
ncbi:MAG: hypothetical protein KJO96_03375 [Winogradskyella sp.]|nr:hypothetical protein [Winogradskyella sp.]